MYLLIAFTTFISLFIIIVTISSSPPPLSSSFFWGGGHGVTFCYWPLGCWLGTLINKKRIALSLLLLLLLLFTSCWEKYLEGVWNVVWADWTIWIVGVAFPTLWFGNVFERDVRGCYGM